MTTRWTAEALAALDAADPLAPFRDRFLLPEGVVHLGTASLGALPKATPGALARRVEAEWGHALVTGWNRHGWSELPTRVAAAIARIVGAEPHEVRVADSTSVDLFELLAAALDLRPDRRVLLSERSNVPTDLYAAQGLVALVRGEVELRLLEEDEPLAEKLDERVACFFVSHVDYRTGRLHDLRALAAAAHEVGALLLVDLAHSAGVLPIELRAANVDLAVGCGSKYLCGGPGAPGFLFVAERHRTMIRTPPSGRMGGADSFAFEPGYRPTPGIGRFLVGTPSILALEALRVGAELVAEADLELSRAKATALAEAFLSLAEERLAGFGFELASPRDPEARGAHLAFRHPEAGALAQAFLARGVVADVRRPDLLRFSFAPLYLRFVDVLDAVERMEAALREGVYRDPRHALRAEVTRAAGPAVRSDLLPGATGGG
ncbi:MAG: aminotransferase class V-fold PLP-dependent enzyme [Geminicoccaceae bacterium]|nr:aminotransferase class V-fold PLP-dependent enzyme [Geminicoccaceae bacterium]